MGVKSREECKMKVTHRGRQADGEQAKKLYNTTTWPSKNTTPAMLTTPTLPILIVIWPFNFFFF